MRRARSGRGLRAALASFGPGRTAAAALAATLAAALVLHGFARAADKPTAQPGHESENVAPAVAYPSGYPRWTHLKSGLIAAGHPAFARFGGLHHIYANPAALEGNRDGRYADGAVLVYDLFETRDSGDGLIDQGPRRHIDVMVKDSRRFAATGGWGYAEFAAGQRSDRLTPADRDGCAACHASRAQHGHVFSQWQNRDEDGAPNS
ncbi:cytochrome P460 family protein [Lysobacter enzymogenes]|uniref:cytochrome P460 family protein n=1 Tax=Lysobacter enzymogenes TaxID=69 RepID=UPI00089D087C|nr:cytochrome P460 family protein [Lysobacter enzymogenes]SDW35473.1 Cytochrome P460 [Lysobacter enzymogenes]